MSVYNKKAIIINSLPVNSYQIDILPVTDFDINTSINNNGIKSNKWVVRTCFMV